MSDRLPVQSTDPLLESRLRRSLRPVGLSAHQRARHLQRLDERGNEELRYLQQRSLSELRLLAAALVVVLAVSAWFAWPSDTTDEPTQLELAQATLTARDQTTTSSSVASATTSAGINTPRPMFSGVCEISEPQVQAPAVSTDTQGLRDWYRNERLWMAPVPPPETTLQLDIDEQESTAASSWYAGSPMQMVWIGSPEPIEVTGVQLDGESILDVVAERLQGLDVYETSVLLPEPGCWQITGTANGTSLSVTVEAAPITDRPDYAAARKIRDTYLLWPTPSTCQATQWVIDDRAAQHAAQWWTESRDLALGDTDGILWEGENEISWITGVFTERGYDFAINAERTDGPSETFELSLQTQLPLFEGSLNFSSPGCWDLAVQHPTPDAGPTTTMITVYVYPAECRPDIAAMEIPSTCRAPESS